MTVEELEIIVTAKVEEAVREINKIIPAIKKQVSEATQTATKSFNSINMKEFSNKLNQAINDIKKKILKLTNKNNAVKISANTQEARKQITQLQKEIDSLQKKITSREMQLKITNSAIDRISADTENQVVSEMPEAGNKRIKQEKYNRLDGNSEYTTLINQSDKLNSEIMRYQTLLQSAKEEMAQLGQQTSQTATTQSKLSSFFGAFKSNIVQAKSGVSSLKSGFQQLPKITQNITNKIKSMR